MSTSYVEKDPPRTIWFLRAGGNGDFAIPNFSDGWKNVGADFGYNASFGFMYLLRNKSFYWGADLGATTFYYSGGDDEVYIPALELSPSIGWRIGKGNVKFDLHIAPVLGYEMVESQLLYGASIGAGLWFGRFNIDVNYQHIVQYLTVEEYKVNDTSEVANLSYMPFVLQLRLGIMFGRVR